MKRRQPNLSEADRKAVFDYAMLRSTEINHGRPVTEPPMKGKQMEEKTFDAWVLYDTCSGYFQYMTGIGPSCTQKLENAKVFDTKKEAMNHSVHDYWSTYFEAIEVEAIEVEV